MAKVVAEFDTVDKSFKVTHDGEKLENVMSFSLYHSEYDDKNYCSVSMKDEYSDNGYTMYHQMVASEDDSLPKSKLEGFSLKSSQAASVDKAADYLTNFLKK